MHFLELLEIIILHYIVAHIYRVLKRNFQIQRAYNIIVKVSENCLINISIMENLLGLEATLERVMQRIACFYLSYVMYINRELSYFCALIFYVLSFPDTTFLFTFVHSQKFFCLLVFYLSNDCLIIVIYNYRNHVITHCWVVKSDLDKIWISLFRTNLQKESKRESKKKKHLR